MCQSFETVHQDVAGFLRKWRRWYITAQVNETLAAALARCSVVFPEIPRMALRQRPRQYAATGIIWLIGGTLLRGIRQT
ncbi:hypothetical protein PpSQ1_00355 [Pseudomonas putida]|nr:hypothetical protein PpSQ1_00355 [Pseudomonas putida]